jgi:hypothetical protein
MKSRLCFRPARFRHFESPIRGRFNGLLCHVQMQYCEWSTVRLLQLVAQLFFLTLARDTMA